MYQNFLIKLRYVVLATEYGKVDARWMRSDPSIVAIEMGSVFFETILSYLVIRGILTKAVYRPFVQTCLCFLQVYRSEYAGELRGLNVYKGYFAD